MTKNLKHATINVDKIYNNMLKELIENYNFTEKEAKVYLACLELGRSRASEIGKKGGLNRITAYEVLKRLIQKGIAQSVTYSNVQSFKVISPEQLVTKIERQANLARKQMPELALIASKDKNKPRINYFEGKEGIRLLYEESLNCQDKLILNIAHPQNLFEIIGQDFFDEYVKKRIRRKIKVKVLLPDLSENKKFTTKSTWREIKFFDYKKFPVPNEILIYDNKVMLLSFSAVIGVVIDDVDISKSIKALWKMVWESR